MGSQRLTTWVGRLAERGRTAAVAALAGIASLGPAAGAEYAVTISGAEGASFGGTCLLVTAKNYAKHETSGTVPITLTFAGDLISCAIQKKTGSGHLRVVIRRGDGEVVADSSQEQPFGVILAAGR